MKIIWHTVAKILYDYLQNVKGQRLKVTNERQDYGAGILHQEVQFPIDQVYLIYKAPMPLSAHARPRETRYWLQMQVGLCVPLNPPPLAHRGS